MNAYDLRRGMTVRLGEHPSAPKLTVNSHGIIQPWNDKVAVIFKEIPMTFYFYGTDRFHVIDWHNDPATHSYR